MKHWQQTLLSRCETPQQYSITEIVLANLTISDLIPIQVRNGIDEDTSIYMLRYSYMDNGLRLACKEYETQLEDHTIDHDILHKQTVLPPVMDYVASLTDDWLKMLIDSVGEVIPVEPKYLPLFINVAANTIAVNTRRGAGNFVILTPQMLKLIENDDIKYSTSKVNQEYSENLLQHIGTISNSIDIYVSYSDQIQNNEIIVGYKGRSDLKVEGDGGIAIMLDDLIKIDGENLYTTYGTFKDEQSKDFYVKLVIEDGE